MSGGSYQIKLYTDAGVELETLTTNPGPISVEYSIVAGDVGVCSIVMPHTWATTNIFTAGVVNDDYKIEIKRTAIGGTEVTENVYMLRGVELYDTERGQFTKLIGVDGNHLMARRHHYAWADDTTYSLYTDEADDLMKTLVTQDFVTDPATGHMGEFSATYFGVAANATLGPSITDDFSYQNILECLQTIEKRTKTAGHPIYWRVVPTTIIKYTFTTYHDIIGTDRTATVTLSQANNNMRNPRWVYDSVKEICNMWLVGADDPATNIYARILEEQTWDTARYNKSVYSKIEGAITDGGIRETGGSPSMATVIAMRALREANPKRTMSFEIAENYAFRYGTHFFFGDLLTWTYRGQSGTAMVKSIVVKYTAQGETVDAGLDIYLANDPA